MMLPPLGLVLAMMIGASLGVFGAGGSIVTVPALVYVVGLGMQEAAATSLLVVGLVAVVGAALRWQTVRPRAAAVLGVSGMLGAVPGAWLNHQVPPAVVLGGFAATLLLAGARLLQSDETAATPTAEHPGMALLGGLGVGLATGFFGVGGGFLIVPALVLLLGLEMPQAAATSLLVIALNSAAGLVAHARYGTVDWQLGLEFAAVALLGAVMAIPLARRLRPRRVQHAFAVVLLVLGIGMLAQGVIGLWT
jgi:uncharacterized membrane protein YfcA